jgi:hypothetical protein
VEPSWTLPDGSETLDAVVPCPASVIQQTPPSCR